MMLGAIEWYWRSTENRPSPCRFFPSCSNYGYEAIAVHGAGRGGWLTIRRLLRCRPLGPSGFDPVPPSRGDGDRPVVVEPHHDRCCEVTDRCSP